MTKFARKKLKTDGDCFPDARQLYINIYIIHLAV